MKSTIRRDFLHFCILPHASTNQEIRSILFTVHFFAVLNITFTLPFFGIHTGIYVIRIIFRISTNKNSCVRIISNPLDNFLHQLSIPYYSRFIRSVMSLNSTRSSSGS